MNNLITDSYYYSTNVSHYKLVCRSTGSGKTKPITNFRYFDHGCA